MEVILIAAMAKNWVIGRDLAIPWHIPEDLQRFKQTTLGHSLIMGRKTFEAIGRALPGRKTVIVSSQTNFQAAGCRVATNLTAALDLCRQAGDEKVFIAGGGQIYQEALALADTIHLSILDREVDGNIFFPQFDMNRFIAVFSERVAGSEPYTLTIFQRVKKEHENGTGNQTFQADPGI